MRTDNRFLNYSKAIQIIILLFSLLALVVIIEFSTLAIVSLIPSARLGNNAQKYMECFHPIFTGKLLSVQVRKLIKEKSSEEYDPWFGYRGNHKTKKGPYLRDKMGFISNGNPSRDISKKPSGVYRIFILGGSTVAGCGVDSPEKSISANLERMLNALPAAKTRFQVINAGALGWYSPQETAFLQFELIYYKPDMVISFDGVNDARRAETILNSKGKKNKKYYWHPYHEKLRGFGRKNNIPVRIFRNAWARSSYNPARYSYFLNFLFYKLPGLLSKRNQRAAVDKKIDELKIKCAKIPKSKSQTWYEVVKAGDWVDHRTLESFPVSESYLFADRFIKNLKNINAVCQANSVQYIAILQPTLLPEFKETMSPLEKFYYDLRRQTLKRDKKNYRLSTLNYYNRCAKLAKEELGNVFFDFSQIIHNEKERMYVDWWHYNERGNVLIASKIKEVVTALINQKSKLH